MLTDGRREQRGISREAEVDMALLLLGALIGVLHYFLQQRKVHECLATEERDVNRTPVARLGAKKIYRGLGGLDIHELRLSLGRSHFVRAELVAVLAREVALVGEIHHQSLYGKDFR